MASEKLKAALLNMSRAEFRKNGQKGLIVLQIATSWTPTLKDDQFVAIVSNLFNDDDQFERLCDLLGLPTAAPGPAPLV